MQQRVAGRYVMIICSPVPYIAGRFTFWSLLLLFIIITFDSTVQHQGGGDGDYVDLGDDIESHHRILPYGSGHLCHSLLKIL